jgi:hypothetical protein
MVQLNLTAAQRRALSNGKNIQVKLTQIGSGLEYDLDECQYDKLMKCQKSKTGKGVRIINGGAPVRGSGVTGETFGGSLLEEYKAYQAKKGGKLKIKNLKQGLKVAKQVADMGAEAYGYSGIVDAGVSQG